MKKQRNIDTGYLVIVVCFIIYFIVFEVINIFYTQYGLSSDAAQTGICSKIFWEAKSLRPPNFFAWTESGVFSLATIGAIIYGMTGSLLAAQGMSPAIMTILILLSIYRLLVRIGTSRKGIALGLLTILCIPLGFICQTITFLSYAAYSVCVLSMFLVLADYIQLISGNSKHKWIIIVFHLLLAIANGCNSSRGILVVYMPLFLFACVRYILKVSKTKKLLDNKENFVLLFTFAMVALSYAATYLPCSSRTDMSKALRRSPIKLVFEVIPGLIEWLRLQDPEHILLKGALVIIVIITIAVALYVLYKHDIEDKHQLVIAYLWCDLLLTMVMLSITQEDVSDRYFFMSYFILSFSLVFIFERLMKRNKRIANIGIGCIVIYAILNLTIFYVPILRNSPAVPERDAIVKFMVDNGYYYGYSDYMDANKLTVHSDGDIQISSIHIGDLSIWRYTTDINWYRPYLKEDMKTAYIVNKQDETAFSGVLEEHPDIKEGYETDNYIIYVADKNYTYID